MTAFVDTDVILDFLLNRGDNGLFAKELFSRSRLGRIKLFTSPIVISNVYYMVSKMENKRDAKVKTLKLTRIIKILDLNSRIMLQGLESNFKDIEDAFQSYCAENAGINILITRNIKDYKWSNLSILTPQEILVKLDE